MIDDQIDEEYRRRYEELRTFLRRKTSACADVQAACQWYAHGNGTSANIVNCVLLDLSICDLVIAAEDLVRLMARYDVDERSQRYVECVEVMLRRVLGLTRRMDQET